MKTDKVFNNVLPWTNVQVRNGAFPLEQYSIFSSFDDAKTYALNNAVAYEGQIIAVTEDGKQKVYVLDSSNTESGLRAVGDNAATIELSTKLYGTPESDTDGDIGQLSAEIKEIKEVSLGSLSSYELSVWSTDSTEDGILKTYHLKQGDTRSFTIDIPKDFLVKSASLETVAAEDIAEGGKLFGKDGFEVGDKYIDFVVNAKDDTEEASHVYLNVKDLVDVYTGSEGDIVDIAVDGTTVKATVKANSIGFSQLCAEVKEYIDAQDAATYLSAKSYIDTVSAALSGDYVKKIDDAQAAAIAKAMEVSSAASAYTDAQIAAHDTTAKELLAQVSADAVTSALTDAKAYADQKIADLDIGQYAISADVSAELCAISTDLEGKIGQTLTDAKDYADQTSANALADAKVYANDICASISTTVDQKIAGLNISQYAISSDVKAELCAVSAETLISAKAYTDEKVGAEATARTEAIQALSDALSGDVKTLADDYKTVKAEYAVVSADYKTVSADHENRIKTLETGTTALSGRMDTAEGNITNLQNIVNSTDLTALAAATGDAQKVASKKYVDDTVASIGDVLHFIGVVAVPAGMDLTSSEEYQALYPDGTTPTKGDVVLDSVSGNEYVYADNYNGSAQWVVIGDENNHATKTELKAEEDARKAADAYLSGAIDNKIYYGDYGSVVSADSLSVVKISQDEYHSLVANDQVDDKAVYIVNNDGAYNMYDERIINVGAPVSANDAATKAYVDAAKEAAIAAIPLSVSQLIWDIEEINCGNAES